MAVQAFPGVNGTTIEVVRSNDITEVTHGTGDIATPPIRRPTIGDLYTRRAVWGPMPISSQTFLLQSPIGWHVTSFGPFLASGMQEKWVFIPFW